MRRPSLRIGALPWIPMSHEQHDRHQAPRRAGRHRGRRAARVPRLPRGPRGCGASLAGAVIVSVPLIMRIPGLKRSPLGRLVDRHRWQRDPDRHRRGDPRLGAQRRVAARASDPSSTCRRLRPAEPHAPYRARASGAFRDLGIDSACLVEAELVVDLAGSQRAHGAAPDRTGVEEQRRQAKQPRHDERRRHRDRSGDEPDARPTGRLPDRVGLCRRPS